MDEYHTDIINSAEYNYFNFSINLLLDTDKTACQFFQHHLLTE